MHETKGEANSQVTNIRNYYRLHAGVYQSTRWTFLFGRVRMVRLLNLPIDTKKNLLEVGCGTGHNLSRMAAQYPNLTFIGLDISPDMLKIASKKLGRFSRRVRLIEQAYATGNWQLPSRPDIILFSYCLTMINPGWENAIIRASEDLEPGSHIAVVDFHDTPFSSFRRWMGHNHVRMDQHLLPFLQERFESVQVEIHKVYGGLWSYFVFVGKKVG